MTKREIFVNVLSEASSHSKQEINDLINQFCDADPDVAATFESEIPDDQIDELSSELRKEATNMVTWLIREAEAIKKAGQE